MKTSYCLEPCDLLACEVSLFTQATQLIHHVLVVQVRHSIEDDIAWLLRRREEDPYKDLVARLMYEAVSNGKQAPTFQP